MCRWLAYIGEPLRPSTIVLDAKHSIVAQSLDSPLGAETVNGDGFGFGWYPSGAPQGTEPALFHSIEPAWNDSNLRELTRAIESPLFFTHVRAAAAPPIQHHRTSRPVLRSPVLPPCAMPCRGISAFSETNGICRI